MGLGSILNSFEAFNKVYAIRTRSRDEYLTAAGDGRVLRWSAQSNGGPSDYQKWYFSSVETIDKLSQRRVVRFRIQNVATRGFLHVGSDSYWASVASELKLEDSTFSFELGGKSSDGRRNYFQLREYSKNEFLGIGSIGWAVRWGKTGGEEQDFWLEPISDSLTPAARRLPAATPCEVVVPTPRKLNSLDDLPQAGVEVLTGEVVLPSALVRDRRFGDPLTQWKSVPYYRLKTFSSFQPPESGATTLIPKGGSVEMLIVLRTLFRETDIKSIEKTFAWELSGEVAGQIEKQTGGDDEERVKGGGSAKFAFAVSNSETMRSAQGTEYEKYTETSKKFAHSAKDSAVRVCYYAKRYRFVLVAGSGYFDSSVVWVSGPEEEVESWVSWESNSELLRCFPDA